MIGTGLEPTQDDIDMVNAAIRISPNVLLPPGTELKTSRGETLRVLYHGQGGRFTIVQAVGRVSGRVGGGLSSRASQLTARLYSYAEVVAIPRSSPPFHLWRRRRDVSHTKGEELERRMLGAEEGGL